jgi:uncharacterized coiled-coil DUF342 family protein
MHNLITKSKLEVERITHDAHSKLTKFEQMIKHLKEELQETQEELAGLENKVLAVVTGSRTNWSRW